ncbi:hypothetical protein Taro_036411 [Colocasia esculenta]|uniref:Secreted protein n=1 Tax=Colocasia esculenta TaxID=4460 RepID=A0A843WG92_COLES|nr:hypothetical protein [Colocasia esculenta]
MGLRQCGSQEWCWLVSIVVWLILVERQLDLSSVAVRLRGRPVWFVQEFGPESLKVPGMGLRQCAETTPLEVLTLYCYGAALNRTTVVRRPPRSHL